MFDQAIRAGSTIKDIDRHRDPVLHEDEGAQVFVITERIYSNSEIYFLRKAINSSIGSNIKTKIISCTPYDDKREFIDKNPVVYYIGKGKKKGKGIRDISAYIPPYSKVICEGRAINYLSRGALKVSDFYDIVFNDSFFFSPDLKTNVYPIPHLWSWMKSSGYPFDDWPHFFVQHQIKQSYNTPPPRTRIPSITYEKVIDIDSFFQEKEGEAEVAIDTETGGLNWNTDAIGCVTLSFDGRKGYYLPWSKIDPLRLGEFLRNKFKIFQHGQFDVKILRKNGVPFEDIWIDYDTMHGGQAINEMSSNSLSSQTWTYTKMGGYDADLEKYRDRFSKLRSYLEIPEDILIPYACYDAIATFQIYKKQMSIIEWIDKNYPPELEQGEFNIPLSYNLKDYLFEFVFPSLSPISDIEYNGMYVDVEILEEEGKKFREEITGQKNKVIQSFPNMDPGMNLDSHEQWDNYLRKQGYPAMEYGVDGLYRVAEVQIAEYINRGYSEFKELKKYRRLSHLYYSFIGSKEDGNGYWEFLQKHDDGSYRLHSTLSAFLKVSGRNGCTNPNLQAVPKHGDDEFAHRIRRIFCPPSKNFRIVEADGKGFQLRIGAAFSGDSEMIRAFTDPNIGGDMHSLTTQAIFRPNMDIQEILRLKEGGDGIISDLRYKGKQANLSLEFGSTAYAFANNTISKSWPISESKQYVRDKNLRSRQASFERVLNYDRDDNGNYSRKKINKIEEERNKEFSYHWAVAEDIIEKFFQRYTGLKHWTETFSNFSTGRGYTRSPYGAIRRLPQMLYIGNDTDMGKVKNWKNITLNSPVQNFENVNITPRLLVGLWWYIRENNLRSIAAMTVHDSVVLYIHEDEIDLIANEAIRIFEHNYPENNGVKMELEIKVADYYNKNEVWGEGKVWK